MTKTVDQVKVVLCVRSVHEENRRSSSARTGIIHASRITFSVIPRGRRCARCSFDSAIEVISHGKKRR